MSGKTDQIKGRIKEAAGALTDNERLKREGKRDQVVGKVKEAAEKVVDKVKKTRRRWWTRQQTPSCTKPSEEHGTNSHRRRNIT